LGTQDLGTRKLMYELLYSGSYTLNATYGPKFTWDQNGPWIRKTFSYTAPYQKPTLQRSVIAPPPPANRTGTTIIRKP
jgi:hypothetical protein